MFKLGSLVKVVGEDKIGRIVKKLGSINNSSSVTYLLALTGWTLKPYSEDQLYEV